MSVAPKPDLNPEDKTKKFIGKRIPKPETGVEAFGRRAAQGAARVLEAGLGAPGNIQNFLQAPGQAIEEKLVEKATGTPTKATNQAGVQRSASGQVGLKFPTSSDIRQNVTKKIFGDYLEPKTSGEKLYGDFLQDATDFYTSGPRALVGKAAPIANKVLGEAAKIGKALMTSATGHAVGEGAKFAGAAPSTQDAARIGTMILVGALDRKGAEKFVDGLYSKADAIAPKGTILPTTSAHQALEPLVKKTTGGITIAEKTAANQALRETKDALSRGTMTVEELTHLRSELLKKKRSMKREGLDPSQYEGLLNDAVTIIDEVMDPLKKTNPEWYQLWRSANQGYRGLHEAGKTSLAFEKAASNANLTPEMAAFLNELAKKQRGIGATLKSAAKYPWMKVREIGHRIIKNPTLRQYYMDATFQSARGNIPAAGKAMERLDKAYQEEEKRKEIKRFIPQRER